MRRTGAALAALAACASCADRDAVDRDALMDPAYCASCHPDHYREWQGSMHAYASEDPVFVAIEGLGQDDTGGAIGTLCLGCHAPMAVWSGAATTAAELDGLPRAMLGVTCYACHQIDAVEGDANGALHYAGDGAFRGATADPVDTPAHGQIYAALADGTRRESAGACGACHDVKVPGGVHLERTFAEWRDSVFAADGPGFLSCGACHMPGRDGLAADVAGAPQRRLHDHRMPGIDVALSPWPETAAQLAGIQRDLGAALMSALCVTPEAGLSAVVTLDNIQIGHAWPSGVTHARRAWVELRAFTEDAAEPVWTDDAWRFGTHLYDADGAPVADPWHAAEVGGELLPFAVTADPSDPRFYHAVNRTYVIPAAADRVELRVLIQPVGLDVLDRLIAAGRLDPDVRDRMPTHEVTHAARTWRRTDGYGCAP